MDYFVNAATNILEQSNNYCHISITRKNYDVSEDLILWPTTPSEFSKTIQSLKTKNSSDFDEGLISCKKELINYLVDTMKSCSEEMLNKSQSLPQV